MDLKVIQSHFKYTAGQRRGILLLFVFIVVLQLVYYLADFTNLEPVTLEQRQWLSLQRDIDVLKKAKKDRLVPVYLFNPNFITDYRGYKLGMSVVEIDRLLQFRQSGNWINSASDFQRVTKVSDSLLAVMSPYFKFPEWVSKKSRSKPFYTSAVLAEKKEKHKIIDINGATPEDLVKIYGIGQVLSERILGEREKYGAFVSMQQMEFIWGLSGQVVAELNAHFAVLQPPNITKLNINTASLKELSQFPFFRYRLAKEIVTYRSMNGGIHNSEDLVKINGFPVEKVNIIALYLEF